MLRTIASRSAVLCRVGRRHLALPPYTELPMPALSPTMTSGNLASWKKAEGEEIAVGDVIAEVETDKATVDYEAQDEGILAKILIPEGAQDITVGAVIGIIVDDAASVAAFKDFTAEAAPAPAAAAEAPPAAAPAPAAPAAAPAAPAAAATPAPTVAVSGAALPTAAGRIYWNPEKGWFRA